MAEPSDLRASDADRDRVAGELRDHFGAGRITEPELDERVQRAYDAGSMNELEAVRADLPALPGSERAFVAQRRRDLRARMFQQTGGTLGAFLICCVIWAATGADGHFWPIWVAIAPAIFLARTGWMLYGPAPELDRAERALERGRKDRS